MKNEGFSEDSGGSSPVSMATQTLGFLASVIKTAARFGGSTEVTMGRRVIEVRRHEALVVVVMTRDLEHAPLTGYLEEAAVNPIGFLLVGELPHAVWERFPGRSMIGHVEEEPSPDALCLAVEGVLDRVELRLHGERRFRSLRRYEYELGELVEIARALSQERNVDRLLNLILEKSRMITAADAGSVYVVESSPRDPAVRTLRFKLSQNDSCAFESQEFVMPLSSRSIAGYAALTKQPVRIEDVYDLASDAPFAFDNTFDDKVGYRTRSTIAIPLVSAEDEVIGVIQLINRKRTGDRRLVQLEDFDKWVIPFDERSEDTLVTLASQAAIVLENAMLYDEIRRIFEGFVRASVQAIEQRDPTTSGHSLRVSLLSCGLAEKVDHVDSGLYADVAFSRRDIKELEYASLLHDFGKIGVREQVLVKARKLHPHESEAIRARVYYAIKDLEASILGRKLEAIENGASVAELNQLDQELLVQRKQLEDVLVFVSEANEPTVLMEGSFEKIAEIGKLHFIDGSGERRPLLSPQEIMSLQITKGSLTSAEIQEIRSHVVHTFNFLSRIPWGKTFAMVPAIAGAHHEYLNGEGYPNRLRAEQIPLQSKIMTVADMYDALTAADRPYKKAIPVERALDILGYEVAAGRVDAELVKIFREAQVYKAVDRHVQY